VNGIIGFSLFAGLPESLLQRALALQEHALAPFAALARQTVRVGDARLEVWGRGDLAARLHHAPDGSVMALVGSPHGEATWTDVPEPVRTGRRQAFEIPWNGRVVLLRLGTDGRSMTMWNDWAGSIPVFHATADPGRVVSTLEPVAAAAVPVAAERIDVPSLLSLLINGHTVGDRTLLKGVEIVPADSVTTWDGSGCCTRRLWTVLPTEDRAEARWDAIVDEMYEQSRKAVAEAVRGAPRWVVPLSSGLDSRLIASIVSDLGVEARTYAWGSRDTVDVVYSEQIASVLGLSWRHVRLGRDYLPRYTRQWASLFGTPLHFHGMYQMAFLDAIHGEAPAPILTGFLGDVLTANPLFERAAGPHQLYDEWLTHWRPSELRSLLRFPVGEPLEEMAALALSPPATPGTRFKRQVLSEVWSRQRLYTAFQSTLSDYWRGVATPFLSRAYARFCLSLPQPLLEDRRALADVYRRHYGKVAVIPGTYADEPLIRSGRYLLLRRVAQALPAVLRVGPLRGFRNGQPRMDMFAVQAHGWNALWPIQDARRQLADWMNLSKLDEAYAAVMADSGDIRPLRKLQSVQAFAHCLLRG